MTQHTYPDVPEPENPWDRHPTESPQAWEAFQTYRDQDRAQRSLRQCAKTLGKGIATIGEWSTRHNWVSRLASYDRQLDERRRNDRETRIAQMEDQQATQLIAARQTLTAPLQAFLTRITEARQRNEDPFKTLSTDTLARLAILSARHLGGVIETERLVAGLSTKNIEPNAPGTADQARQRANDMNRQQLENYLLGVDDGARHTREQLGLQPPNQ